ncbi:MAG: glycoside hydrolase family 9 protein, partial [Oscillospiraceae bacterium]|nr:glycoside hydrolase family 9 protein [Oscillospiraceae bacterium]
ARLWEPYDSAKAAKYLDAAKASYDAYKTHWKEYTSAEASNKQSLYPPLDQAIGGGAYGDTDSKDDAYWAACELYATTGDSKYYDDLASYDKSFQVLSNLVGGENKGSFGSFNWGNTSSCGSLSLYLNQDKLTQLTDANKKSIVDSMKAAADLYVEKENAQGYGIPYEGAEYSDPVNLPADLVIKGYEWGSNSFVINNAMIMAYAYDETDDIKYMNGVATAMDYIFGRNPLSVSFVTGYGSYAISRPHHRYWSNELDKTLPMAPDGVMSGGPNAGLQDPYVRALGFVPGDEDNASQRCYVDSIEAWSTNEVTINWNSPFAWVVSFMQDEAAEADGEIETDPTTTTDPTTPSTNPSEDPSDDPSEQDPSTTAAPTGSVDPSVDYIYGDVNLDGAVSVADIAKLSKFIANGDIYPVGNGDAVSENQAKVQANVAYDEAIDSIDLNKLIEYCLNNIQKSQLGPQ